MYGWDGREVKHMGINSYLKESPQSPNRFGLMPQSPSFPTQPVLHSQDYAPHVTPKSLGVPPGTST